MKSFDLGAYAFSIQRRNNEDGYRSIAVALGSILCSFLLIGVALRSYGVNPVEAYSVGFSYALSGSGITELVVRMIPLLLVGLSVYIPLRAGLYNVAGGAGIYAGGIVAAAVALSTPDLGTMSLGISLLGGALAGMAVLSIPGILRAYWEINEILTTLLLTFIFIRLNNFSVKLMRGEGGTLTGEALPSVALSPTLGGSRIHIGLLFAILGFVMSYILFKRTKFGYEIDMFGGNPTAAIRSGINEKKIIIGTFLIAGALAGIAGAAEIVGVHGRLLPDFSPGYGFTAVAIAIIARDNIFRVLGATLLFAFVYILGSRMELVLPVPSAVIAVFEATIILFFLLGEGISNYQVELTKQTSTGAKEVISV